MKTRTWTPAALALCAGLLPLAGASDLYAQAAIQAPVEYLQRSMLRVSFRNLAVQDSWFDVGSGEVYMSYPSQGGAGSYGSVRTGAYSFVVVPQVRLGHGVWTFTSDQRVAYSGVRPSMVDQHFKSMQYNVEEDADLSKLGTRRYPQRRPKVKLGFGAQSATGVEETSLGGNWWPGSDLIKEGKKAQSIALAPVHIMNFNLGKYPTYDEWPEEIIITKATNSQGITITERAFAWSHLDFDDFFLDEYIFENTGDKDGDGKRDLPEAALNNLFIGFQDRFNNSSTSQMYVAYWRDELDFHEDDWFVYDQKDKVLYNYDGDHPVYMPWDDSGDPYKDTYVVTSPPPSRRIGQTENMLMSPAHVGVGVVAYTDDPSSPYKFNARDEDRGYVSPQGDQPYAVRFWASFGQTGFDKPPAKVAVPQGEPNLGEMTEAQMHSEVLGKGRTVDPNPSRPSSQFSMLVFGPYNLPPGGKAKIVLAYVAGHPGQVLGNTDVFTWARKGNQAELPKGLDALKQNLAAARFAYANAYDIPDAPPDVNFQTGSNATANMTMEWSADMETSSHPDYTGTEANDVAGYRVYRSTWFGDGPWELIADVPKGTTTVTPTYKVSRSGNDYVFEDLRSAAGFFYHYSVRAYSKGHSTWTPRNPKSPLEMPGLPAHIASRVQAGQEGGWSAGTQRTYADESPFAVPSPATEALDAPVRVVPNPFFSDRAHTYPASTKIRFVGIPSKSRIRIFSVSGDLVSIIDHDVPGRGEADYNQVTWNNSGEIATGAYFWVVENLIPGPNLGKLQKGTLMVIR